MYYHFIVRLLNKKRYDEAFDLAKICFNCIRDEVREGSSSPVLKIEAKRYYNYMLYASRKAVDESMAEWRAEREKEKRFIDKLR
jgi:hypothetical protein